MTPSSTTRLVPFRSSSSMVMVTPTWGTGPPGERTKKERVEKGNWYVLQTETRGWSYLKRIHCRPLPPVSLPLSFSHSFSLFQLCKLNTNNAESKSHQLLFLKFIAPSVFITSRYPSAIQVQHPLESRDPKWNAIIKVVDAFCESKVVYICLCTYWINESEVKVLHAKIQQFLLLQGATEVSDNLLCNMQAWSPHENEKDSSSLKWLDSDSSLLQVNK